MPPDSLTSQQSKRPPLANMPLIAGDALLGRARDLAKCAQEASPLPSLLGKNLGVVSAHDDADTALFCDAARELGAHVALIRPNLTERSAPHEVQDTARMLGRLYAAVEWPGVPMVLNERIGRESAIPIYNGIPLAELANQLDIEVPYDVKRRLLIQAALLMSLA
jgi:ornithine carbamoyltransferase